MRALLVALALLLATTVMAQNLDSPINGTIINAKTATPLAGVHVAVEVSGTMKSLPHPTDSTGRFAVDPSALFDPQQLDTYALTLSFSKQGFRSPEVCVLSFKTRGQLRHANLQVALKPMESSDLLDHAEKAKLEGFVSIHGRTVYLLPYTLTPLGVASARDLNQRLPQLLQRRITTYLQALRVKSLPEVSLESLPQGPAVTNTERVSASGEYLNALAMIGGQGHIKRLRNNQEILELASQYLIIPWLEGFTVRTWYIDDSLPPGSIALAALANSLNKLWGRSTLLALSLREFIQAKADRDTERLKRIRTYLIAERSQAGPDNEPLLSQVKSLLELVEKELR